MGLAPASHLDAGDRAGALDQLDQRRAVGGVLVEGLAEEDDAGDVRHALGRRETAARDSRGGSARCSRRRSRRSASGWCRWIHRRRGCPCRAATILLGDGVQCLQIHLPRPVFYCSSAATPGSVLPSIHSRNAPPAVETKVKSLADAGRVQGRHAYHRRRRPPPACRPWPARRRAAPPRACPRSNGGTSNTPSGPFQIRVLDASIAWHSRSTVSGPASRMRSCVVQLAQAAHAGRGARLGLLADDDVDRQQQLAVVAPGVAR